MFDPSGSLAPGMRAVIRAEEWLIRHVDPATDCGCLLTCDGISDLVRSQSAFFLTTLDDKIEILDPATTTLVLTTTRSPLQSRNAIKRAIARVQSGGWHQPVWRLGARCQSAGEGIGQQYLLSHSLPIFPCKICSHERFPKKKIMKFVLARLIFRERHVRKILNSGSMQNFRNSQPSVFGGELSKQ